MKLINLLLFPLGCFGGGGGGSVPLPAPAPQAAQGDVVSAAQGAMQRARAAASNTQLTPPGGVQGMAKLQMKSLLGS